MRGNRVGEVRRVRLTVGGALTALLATVVVVGPLAQSAAAATYTADSEATWRTAVSDALANSGETNTITLTGSFIMNDPGGTWPAYSTATHDLIIDGGGYTVTAAPGNNAGFIDAYNLAANVTLQNITLVGFESNFAAYIFTDFNVTIDNVTVTDFSGDYSSLGLGGDQILVTDSTFTDNSSLTSDGGAIHVTATSPTTVSNSTFSGNDASGSGGALFSNFNVAVFDSTFTDNDAVAGQGGAAYVQGELYIGGSTFEDNSAPDDGGAVFGDDIIDVTESSFVSNSSGDSGGAIYSDDDTDIEFSTFSSNTATNNGGAIYVYDGSFSVDASTFVSNSAGGYGGAVYAYEYADSFESTWTENSAQYGGAIYSEGGTDYSYYWQSTFEGNTATFDGGAVYAQDDYVEVYHSVFSGNEAPGDGAHIYVSNDYLQTYASVYDNEIPSEACYAASGVTSLGFNADADGTCSDGLESTGDTGSDPMLGALADNGGPTKTMAPLTGSPLVDAIPWATCDAYETGDDEYWDQRGVLRADTGANPDGCDIGAVEVIKDLTFPIAGTSGITTITVSGALDYECESWTSITGYSPAPPAGVSFPHGVFNFCLVVPAPGWTATVQMDLPSPVNGVWKETSGVWTQVSGVAISGTTVTYSVTDGGALDDDGSEDAYIVDPVGAGNSAGFTG